MSSHTKTEPESLALAEARLLALCSEKRPGWEIELAEWLYTQSVWLRRHCVVLLGNQSDAEDAVQEVMWKAMRAFEQFEARASLRTWVARIADNHCYSVKKQRASRIIGTHLQHCIALHEQNRMVDATSELETAESSKQVRSTLECLSANNRTVLQLRFFEELSLAQMASALDLSLSATKMRLYRAMNAFKKTHVITSSRRM